MSHRAKPMIAVAGLVCLSLLALAGCDAAALLQGNVDTNTGDLVQAAPPDKVSEGRENAARALTGAGTTLYVDLLQRDVTIATQDETDPFGVDAGHTAWTSRIGGGMVLSLATLVPGNPGSEYDLLKRTGDTGYVLSLRVPSTSVGSATETQVEFNFRAVNPFAWGRDPAGAHYNLHEGDYPSNDATVANRSLIDVGGGGNVPGGSVAIVVRGLQFATTPTSTSAFMNGLGNKAWLGFMRDDAFPGGRFYYLPGVRTQAPQAFADTASTSDDGIYHSVQINGEPFDYMSTSYSALRAAGQPDPKPVFGNYSPYCFMDLSNVDGAASPAVNTGRGGFIFIMRSMAFSAGGPLPVVVDPSAATPSFALPGGSGYNEQKLSAFVSDQTNHTPVNNVNTGTSGVHELSLSVYFTHLQAGG